MGQVLSRTLVVRLLFILMALGVALGALRQDRWTHIAIVWAPLNNSFRMYEDGVALLALETLRESDIADGRAYLARGFTDGYLDEVRIWSRVRETSEIEEWHRQVIPSGGYVGNNAGRLDSSTLRSVQGRWYDHRD